MARLVRWAGGWRWVFALSLVVATGFMLRVPSLDEPMWYSDEGYFASIASGVRNGGVLYKDHFDIKAPMIFWTYAGVQSLFGTSVAAIHATSIAAMLLTYAAVIYLARELGSPARAVIAASILTLLLAGPVLEANLALTENFVAAFTALAACAWLVAMRAQESRKRAGTFLVCGALFGIAANYKQVAIFDAAAFGLVTLLALRRPIRPLLWMIAGGILSFVPFGAYAVVTGSLPGYWEAMLGGVGDYAAVAPPADALLRWSRYLPLALVAGWLIGQRLRGRFVPLAAIAPLWLVAAFAGAVSSTFPWVHYLLHPLPALALTLSLVPLRPGEWIRRERALQAIFAVISAYAVLWVVDKQFGIELSGRGRVYHETYYGAYFDHLAGRIDDREYATLIGASAVTVNDAAARMTIRDDNPTLFVWGHLPWLYTASGFANPAKHYSSFDAVYIPGALATMQDRLAVNLPDYVMVMDAHDVPFPWLNAEIASRYRLVVRQNDWTLFVRDDLGE